MDIKCPVCFRTEFVKPAYGGNHFDCVRESDKYTLIEEILIMKQHESLPPDGVDHPYREETIIKVISLMKEKFFDTLDPDDQELILELWGDSIQNSVSEKVYTWWRYDTELTTEERIFFRETWNDLTSEKRDKVDTMVRFYFDTYWNRNDHNVVPKNTGCGAEFRKVIDYELKFPYSIIFNSRPIDNFFRKPFVDTHPV